VKILKPFAYNPNTKHCYLYHLQRAIWRKSRELHVGRLSGLMLMLGTPLTLRKLNVFLAFLYQLGNWLHRASASNEFQFKNRLTRRSAPKFSKYHTTVDRKSSLTIIFNIAQTTRGKHTYLFICFCIYYLLIYLQIVYLPIYTFIYLFITILILKIPRYSRRLNVTVDPISMSWHRVCTLYCRGFGNPSSVHL